MAKFARKGLIAAMEDGDLEGLEGTEVVGDDEAASTAMMDVAEQESEVVEEVTAIESLSFAIEEAIEDVGAAEEIVDTVEEVAEADGEGGEGLTEGEAIIAEEALKICMRRLAPGREQILPSMESFRSANSRKTATRVGLEGVVEKIKSVWEKILQAIKAMWTKLVTFFKKVTDANISLEKAAKALKEKVRSNKQVKVKEGEKEFENSSIFKNFPKTGTVTASFVKDVVENHNFYASKSGGVAKATVDAIKTLVTVKVSDQNSSTAVKDAAEEVANAFATYVAGKDVKISIDSNDVKEVVGDKFLIGGKSTKADVKLYFKANGDDIETDFSIAAEIQDHENTTKTEAKVEIASKNDMISICDAVTKLAVNNSKFVLRA